MAEAHLSQNQIAQKHKAMRIGTGAFLVVGTILFAGFLVRTDLPFGQCHRLSCLQLSDNAVLKLTEVYEDIPGSVYRARYQMGDFIVRVDVRSDVEPDAAIDYIHGRVAGMKALYDNLRSPYPGLLSNEIVCDEGFKPTYRSFTTAQTIQIQEIVGYLNDRLTFGSCQKDQAVYRGLMVLAACPKQKMLYQIEFITPIESFNQSYLDTLTHSLTCR